MFKNLFAKLFKKNQVVAVANQATQSIVLAQTPIQNEENINNANDEITTIFLELSKEMSIPFVKGPNAPKRQKTIKSNRTPKTSGMNHTKMVAALKENYNNTEALTILFTNYEELFIKNVERVKDDTKRFLLTIIQTKYPNATLQLRNHKVKYIVLD